MFERVCEVCQRTYNSENSYNNHMSSQRHKQRVLETGNRKHGDHDAANSVMSSTFSLGEPISSPNDEVDSDAEEEFHEVVEGLKKTSLKDRMSPSPVKRPGNPRPSAGEPRTSDHATSAAPERVDSTTPVPGKSEPAWTVNSCLFCNYNSPTVALNAHHMERFHSMFFPEKRYLVNMEGLIEHLQSRVHERHQCIACGKVKADAFAVQTHMRDKSHCAIPYTTLEEQLDIGDFYDFRSTYSDGDDDDDEWEEDESNGGVKLAAEKAKGPGQDKLEGSEDEEWETDSDYSVESSEITRVYGEGHYHQYERLDKHVHHSRDDPRHHHQVDGWHSHAHKPRHAVFYDDYSLHLPSGKSVGHRSLNVYYRQNLYNYPSEKERAERLAIEGAHPNAMEVDGEPGNEVVTVHTRFGSRTLSKREMGGMAGVPEAKTRAVQRAELRGRTQQNRGERAMQWKKDRYGNKTKAYAWDIGKGLLD